MIAVRMSASELGTLGWNLSVLRLHVLPCLRGSFHPYLKICFLVQLDSNLSVDMNVRTPITVCF